ncbi:MAG: arginyl-tRNA--protein arginylyltransferase [Cytophagales bacterium]
MFGKVREPDSLSKFELDEYLQFGWYRMGQSIFTCSFLNFKTEFYDAVWLRLDLSDFNTSSTFKKLERLNAKFQSKIGNATITAEKEALYAKYKTSISFETAISLQALLLDTEAESIFDTKEICIYDQSRLIAVGYFDMGHTSAAGIVSFFDPDYKKHSLGKYLIYNKIAYCQSIGLHYFYPGYFAPNYPLFDYKLSIGKQAMEYFDICTNGWLPISQFDLEQAPLAETKAKLQLLYSLLNQQKMLAMVLKYEYYNANNISHLKDLDLFDYPLFLMVQSPAFKDFFPIVVYDVIDKQYRLLKYYSVFHDENYKSINNYYGEHLLKIAEVVFSSEDAQTIVGKLNSRNNIEVISAQTLSVQ